MSSPHRIGTGRRTKITVATGAALVVALGSGCGVFGGDDSDERNPEESKYLQILNDGIDLENQLSEHEARFLRQCMEDQGFDIHDPLETEAHPEPERDNLTEENPSMPVLLSVEEAEENAFGMWREAPQSGEGPGDGPQRGSDNYEFFEQPADYQRDYYTALYGTELMEYRSPWLVQEVEEDAVSETGSMGTEPKPEGCKGDMVDAVYGGGQIVSETVTDDEWSYFTYRPEMPQLMTWNEQVESMRTDEVVETQLAFETCLADNGQGEWEFDEQGAMQVDVYFTMLYFGTSEALGSDDWYQGPSPDPSLSDYEEIRAHEFDLAGTFAECNEETEASDVIGGAWLELQLEQMRDLESEFVAWQDQMKEHLQDLQALLSQ
ncbi:hypothetical protein [Natronoglycomyces albus]|uniref:Uncharacterized protein n=1 Tax=Natronoglycomyces albus TaxID=2811108 RepID=A0A895XQK6_9ACTN|nr:hypothetical protein [Natronoglycomyces albus]QSB04550.1 hypothetical protein JQS30_12305 [Natronoglycomyces albus]